MAGINPNILTWARETAGLDLETAARKVALKKAHGISGADRLAELEAGKAKPSMKLVKRMAKHYRRPLTTFFLPYLPRPAEIGHDFRTLLEGSETSNALLAALLRDVKARQGLVREALEDDEDAKAVAFIGSCRDVTAPSMLSDAMISAVDFERKRFRASKDHDDAFTYLRGIVEHSGVYVLLAGDCGSWQTAIEVSVFRGFAIADKVAPFIVINDQDARAAWSFTMLHELAHLLIGASGVSGGSMPEGGLEKLCNDAAAACLVAQDELKDEKTFGDERDIPLINSLANRNKVSRTMIAYQLYLGSKLPFSVYEALRDTFRSEWLAGKAEQKEKDRERDASGPNWYVVRRHRLGAALLSVAREGLADGTLTPVRAARMLGVKPVAVYPLLAPARLRAAGV